MKYDSLPPIIQQAIVSMLDPNTTAQVKFNNMQTLTKVKEACESAIATYNKKYKK
jgi:hypothetical protein